MNKNLKPFVIALASVFSTLGQVHADDVVKGQKVEVISQTPLPGAGLTIDQTSNTVQTVKAEDIQKSQSLDITDFMNRNMSGVYINENQGNPLMPDVNYHGFTASPLLGTPQGMSVYMDGVRLNQPFGDVVNWDLIPKNAISSMQLYSGNPLFGLNTLGGALSIQTKDGRTNPGGAVQFSAGSWGRKIGEFEYGGISPDNSVDYFVAGTWFNEDGWRDHSKSDNKQLFTKLGWQGEKTSLKLTYAYAKSDLNGNGTAPLSTLSSGYEKVYTWPDNTQNDSHFLNLNWARYFTDNIEFSGNAYFRKVRTSAINGDVGESNPSIDSTDAQKLGQTILASATTALTDANLIARCRANTTAGTEPAEKCTGLMNREKVDQDNYGIFAQVSVQNKIFDLSNSYVIGGGYDRSESHFTHSAEFGSILSDRSFYGSGVFAEPQNNLNQNGKNIDDRVDLKGTTKTWSVYGTDTIDLLSNLHLTGALRYNHTKVSNRDQISHYDELTYAAGYAVGVDNGNTLSADYTYSRINPSVGLAFNPVDTINLYGSYSEGSRAPTSIELGCADSENPCKLPNSMANDPFLKQVVSRTWEAGVRAKLTPDLSASASIFDTRNANDILFVGSTSNGGGYFKNFGETERKGFDGSFSYQVGQLSFAGNYTYLDATYQSDETIISNANVAGTINCQSDGTVNSSTHICVTTNSSGTGTNSLSTGASGTNYQNNQNLSSGQYMYYNNNNDYWKTIDVKKGNRIPLVPHHVLKLFADYKINDKLTIGANTFTASGSVLRGNENGLDSRGEIAGYTTLNLTATYRFQPEWMLFAKMNNVFDKEYYTSGMLGMNAYNADGSHKTNATYPNYAQAVSEAFVAPGAPRAAWVGVRYEFGGKKPSSLADKD